MTIELAGFLRRSTVPLNSRDRTVRVAPDMSESRHDHG